MHPEPYPATAILSLLQSPHLTPQTRDVLQMRLAKKERIQPAFLDDGLFRVLEAVCNCLYPPEPGQPPVPLAVMLEEELATGPGRGWRFDALPPLQEMFMQGLHSIDDEARTMQKKSFIQASPGEQEQVLQAVQQGRTTAASWKTLSPQLFFTELLASATELYYSHPQTKDIIGDASFADQPGWQHIGLNGFDGREPHPINAPSNE